MTKEEILRKAIEKAVRNGYDWYGDLFKHWQIIIAGVGFWDEDVDSYAKSDLFGRREQWSVEEIIFSHDFAKAFWGEESIGIGYDQGEPYDDRYPAWQHHLMIMVLEENPIKYLEQFLESNNKPI